MKAVTRSRPLGQKRLLEGPLCEILIGFTFCGQRLHHTHVYLYTCAPMPLRGKVIFERVLGLLGTRFHEKWMGAISLTAVVCIQVCSVSVWRPLQ